MNRKEKYQIKNAVKKFLNTKKEEKEMKTSMRENTVVAVNLLAGFIITAAPKMWARPCEEMMTLENGNQAHMRCFYSGQALVILGVILLVNALVMFLAKNKLQGGLVAVATGTLSFFVTTDTGLGIGICAHARMACHVMASWSKLAAGLIIITGIILVVFSMKYKK